MIVKTFFLPKSLILNQLFSLYILLMKAQCDQLAAMGFQRSDCLLALKVVFYGWLVGWFVGLFGLEFVGWLVGLLVEWL